MNQEKDLLSAVRELVDAHFSDLRRTVRKNLARLTCAFLHLAWSIRFGYGGLHLTSIARVLPQGKKFKSSYKWLSRFLKCKYFDASSLAECMLAVILGNKPPGWVIVLVDQTTVNGVMAIEYRGRALRWQEIPAPARPGALAAGGPSKPQRIAVSTAKRKWVPLANHPWREAARRAVEKQARRASRRAAVAKPSSLALPCATP